MSETNRSEMVFDVVCLATMPALTLLVGAIGLALLQLIPQPRKEPSK